MDAILVAVAGALACGVLLLLLKRLEERLRVLEQATSESGRLEQDLLERVRDLTRRIYQLERKQAAVQAQDVALEEPKVSLPSLMGNVTTQETVPGAVEQTVIPSEVVASLPESRAESPPHEDWELTIGGNWLNKLGALILVVGIALFLGYSLTTLGPSGKIAIGFLIGISMLGAGVALERKEPYRIFSKGFIGGGWAAIYFTTYAMHAFEAARVISDPYVATFALLIVSILIILHSFRYGSEPITLLAFVIGFVSLNITQVTPFSGIATLILSLSLIAVGYRFRWNGLSLVGVILAYLSYIRQYGMSNGSNAPASLVILWTYWITFEAYDILGRLKEKVRHPSGLFFFVNAGLFFVAFIAHNLSENSHSLQSFLTTAAAAYFMSMLARLQFLPEPNADDPALAHFVRGLYPSAAAVAAAYAAGSLAERFSGLELSAALLIEGEIVVGAGYFFRRRSLYLLGGAVLVLPFAHLTGIDLESSKTTVFLGHVWAEWSPLFLATAAVFYANRVLTGSGILYTFAASILVNAVVHQEVEKNWATVCWAAFALAALALGLRLQKLELRIQAYLLALMTAVRACLVNLDTADKSLFTVTIALVAATFYAAQLLILRKDPELRGEGLARVLYSVMGTGLITALLFNRVQGSKLTVALGMEAASLLIGGFYLRERVLRLSGLALFLFCILKVFLNDLAALDTFNRILSFIVLGLILLGASWVYTRFREQIRKLL